MDSSASLRSVFEEMPEDVLIKLKDALTEADGNAMPSVSLTHSEEMTRKEIQDYIASSQCSNSSCKAVDEYFKNKFAKAKNSETFEPIF